MNLNYKDLFILSQCAISAAFQAGRKIELHIGEQTEVNLKEGGASYAAQVLTKVDKLSQDVIMSVLKPTCEYFNLAMLSEESEDDGSRLQKDYFWCIDPLDGTLSFIENTSGFAVSIALVAKNGEPQIGVVYDPSKKDLYYAIRGKGAFKNGKTFKFCKTSNKEITFFTDKGFLKHPKFDYYYSKINEYSLQTTGLEAKIISHAGAVLNACWIAENMPACYFKLPKKEEGGGSLWDFAATACILNETGAIVSDIRGKKLELNRKESTFMNHAGVLFGSDEALARFIMQIVNP